MYQSKLWKNKIYAIIFIFIGLLTVFIEWDVTFFLLTIILGIPLFFSKDNHIKKGAIYMKRAERRRILKNEKKEKTAIFNLTRAQLDLMVQEQIKEKLDEIKQEVTDDAVNTAMILMLTLPLKVLMDYYWKKSYARRIPEFSSHVLEYYEMWQNGELDMDEMREELWECGGIRLQKSSEDTG